LFGIFKKPLKSFVGDFKMNIFTTQNLLYYFLRVKNRSTHSILNGFSK